MLPGVMACITFAAMALCVKKADKQNRKMLYLMCFVLSCGNAVCVRIQQAAAPEALFQAAVLKFCASLPTVILVYTGYRYEKNSKMARFLLTAVTLCLAADIAINLSFAAGGFLFLSGHLFFDAAFITERKPDRKQFAQLIVSAAGGAVLLLLLYKHINSIPLYVGALTYMTVLFSTLIFSFKLDRRFFAAAAVFAVSDGLMELNSFISSGMFMQILALCVYYGALILYGIALWERCLKNKQG